MGKRLICRRLRIGIMCAAIMAECFGITLSPGMALASYFSCSAYWDVGSFYGGGTGDTNVLCGALGVNGSYAYTNTTSKGPSTIYSGQGSAYSNASMGVNHIDVSGSVELNKKFLLPYYYDGVYGAGGAGNGWFDSIKIVSIGKLGSRDYLPFGTPVEIQTTFYIDASAKASPTYTGDPWEPYFKVVGGGWNESAFINVPGTKFIKPTFPSGWTGGAGNNLEASFQASNTQWPVINKQGIVTGYEGETNPSTEIILDSTGKVGSSYLIGVELNGGAFGESGPFYKNGLFDQYVLGGSATLDASQTALFGLQILTPGASYISQSGTLYPTSVIPISATPEPSSWALFGTGLMGLSLWLLSLQRRNFKKAQL